MVDELGSHLHPTWKMKVVRQLRQLLPSMQFLATTHDPLCLRGLVDNETVLMRRHEAGYAWGQGDLGSTAGLRVDQLLTSRFFGLSSTIDPELDDQFDEYYQLLAMSRSELEQHGLVDRLDKLKSQLDGVGMLGYTRRDQLIYEAIDEFLGKVKAGEADDSSSTAEGEAAIEQRRKEVFRRVGRLWTYQSVLQGLGEEAPGEEL